MLNFYNIKMPFCKSEKYPNTNLDDNEDNDNAYYNSGSPDFGGSYHSEIDAAGQYKCNNNNNIYPDNIFSFSPHFPIYPIIPKTSLFGNSGGLFGNNYTNNNQGDGLFGNNYTNNSQGGGLFGNINTNNNQGGGLFGNNYTNNNQGGGLFGNINTNNNQGGGLFGNNTNNNQGGGLFGNTNNNQGGGLFGYANNNNNLNSPSSTISIFGNNTMNLFSFGDNSNNNNKGNLFLSS